ncbi:hypothetical protein C0J52_05823 [Blattella germanica]|nr:hypothetical protein C0J52_05823 [Blattella germanica]
MNNMYNSQSDPFWKKPYKVRKRVDSIDRYPNKVGSKYHQHTSPMDVFKEYCEKTTLHGIRYTMRDGAPTYDRLSWVITLVVCASFAGLFVKTAWVKFRNSPTVTSVETTHLPLHKVPFPAITICPATKVNRIRGLNYLKRQLNLTYLNSSMESELEHVMSAFSMLQHPFYDRMVSHLDDIPDLSRYNSLNITEFMLEKLNVIKIPDYISSAGNSVKRNNSTRKTK